MKVNPKLFATQDMLGNIQLPNCPSQFKGIAENIINLLTQPGYSIGEYHTMTELDKTLMFDYWNEFDGMVYHVLDDFKQWFIKSATAPELIRRARQWLSEKNYVIIDPDVAERAMQAGSKFSKSIKS